ncbi:prolyl aminopeptidase [candidate division KSB1 bacterium]|nr:prolyl aminopeptidase [candidate division KSB1 bacterium]
MKQTIVLLLIILISVSCSNQKSQSSVLWPTIQPYQTGLLKVSDIHELYFELSGNPKGAPVFGLHGGPGGNSSPYMRRFFNPEKFLIVLYDQRGAGQSRPFGEIQENTTWHLVEDIEKLRQHLNLGKIILFGGSWGSTLALAYAETYPQHVAGMVLRGVFLATKAEIDHFYHGGVQTHFPETYNKLLSSLPDPDRRPLPAYLFELIQQGDSLTKARCIRAWAEYEIKVSSLSLPDSAVETILNSFDPSAFSVLENYYMSNNCFFAENQLLTNADKLRDIQLIMVNGRYDVICPPVTAYKLQQRLPNARLIIAEGAGHWMGEPSIEQALIKAMQAFE